MGGINAERGDLPGGAGRAREAEDGDRREEDGPEGAGDVRRPAEQGPGRGQDGRAHQELKVKAGEISGDAKEDKKKAKGKGPKGDPEEIKKLTQEIEDYKLKLKTEFGYTKNDIAKDEDILEMQKRLKAMGN